MAFCNDKQTKYSKAYEYFVDGFYLRKDEDVLSDLETKHKWMLRRPC